MELKAGDLRIGNIFYAEDETLHMTTLVKIIEIWEGGVEWESITECNKGFCQKDFLIDLEPIELSEDILLKAGFEKGTDTLYHLDKVSINMPGVNGYEKGRLYYNSWFIIPPPKYVHTLQNLIFALSGTELTLIL